MVSVVTGELSIVIDFWLAKTLDPAVVISNDACLIANLVKASGDLDSIKAITNVNVAEYKMMRSLYDPNDAPNLRDDILSMGRGAFVAVELLCETVNSQQCIRELIEDTPSMTAFSTEKSALNK